MGHPCKMLELPIGNHMTKKLKHFFANLNVKSVFVHWDTKIMGNTSGKSVDRLAVIVTMERIFNNYWEYPKFWQR
jgi:hypothetical protein